MVAADRAQVVGVVLLDEDLVIGGEGGASCIAESPFDGIEVLVEPRRFDRNHAVVAQIPNPGLHRLPGTDRGFRGE